MGDNNGVSNDWVAQWIEETKTWYISDQVLNYLDFTLIIPVHGILSIGGSVTNLINTVIFVKIGLKNSMNVGLLALSVTDLCVTFFQTLICCSYLVTFIYPDSPVDPWMLGGYMFSWARYVAYLISCWITNVIAMERCYCVVSPFTVRRVFTRLRCVYSVIIIYAIHIAIHAPVFYYAKLEWVPVATQITNLTVTDRHILTVVFNEDSARFEVLSDLVAGIGLSLISQIGLLVSTIWMIISLSSSSKIRHHQSTDAIQKDDLVKGGVKNKETLSPKERKMAKTVLFLSIMVSICNVPRFITTAVHHLLPGMNLGAFQNLETFLWEVSYFFGTICCSCNFFVYLNLNSQFRMIAYSCPRLKRSNQK